MTDLLMDELLCLEVVKFVPLIPRIEPFVKREVQTERDVSFVEGCFQFTNYVTFWPHIHRIPIPRGVRFPESETFNINQ